VGEGEQGARTVLGELVADDPVVDDPLAPLVLEHVRRVPDEDAAGHALLLDRGGRLFGHHLDRAAGTGVDDGLAEPGRALAWVGERRPYRRDRVRQVAAEGDRGAVAVDLEGSVAIVSHPWSVLRGVAPGRRGGRASTCGTG
jgi:hypothetical protein